MKKYDLVYLVLAGIFVSSLVLANALVFKFFDVSLPLVGLVTLSVGIVPYPITFLVTDLISELYGKKRADAVVLTGFVVSIFMIAVLQIGKALPVSHLQSPEIQEHYLAVFGASTRAVFASMMAYLIAQFIDVRLYHFWRRRTQGRHLWLRNNFSTMFSQMLDTVLVVTILFAGVWSTDQIVAVIIASYCFKLLVAAGDTPLLYLGRALLMDIQRQSEAEGALDPSPLLD